MISHISFQHPCPCNNICWFLYRAIPVSSPPTLYTRPLSRGPSISCFIPPKKTSTRKWFTSRSSSWPRDWLPQTDSSDQTLGVGGSQHVQCSDQTLGVGDHSTSSDELRNCHYMYLINMYFYNCNDICKLKTMLFVIEYLVMIWLHVHLTFIMFFMHIVLFHIRCYCERLRVFECRALLIQEGTRSHWKVEGAILFFTKRNHLYMYLFVHKWEIW